MSASKRAEGAALAKHFRFFSAGHHIATRDRTCYRVRLLHVLWESRVHPYQPLHRFGATSQHAAAAISSRLTHARTRASLCLCFAHNTAGQQASPTREPTPHPIAVACLGGVSLASQ